MSLRGSDEGALASTSFSNPLKHIEDLINWAAGCKVEVASLKSSPLGGNSLYHAFFSLDCKVLFTFFVYIKELFTIGFIAII